MASLSGCGSGLGLSDQLFSNLLSAMGLAISNGLVLVGTGTSVALDKDQAQSKRPLVKLGSRRALQ